MDDAAVGSHDGDRWNASAALLTLRSAPVTDDTEVYGRVDTLDKPIAFLWGERDVGFPYADREEVATLMPRKKVTAIDQVAHRINIE